MGTELQDQIAELESGDHLCLIYDTPEQQIAAVVPFMKLGIERGQRCLYIVDQRTAAEVRAALEGEGVDVGGAEELGLFRLLTKKETYLRNGGFEPDAMLAVLDDAVAGAMSDGRAPLRTTGEMTWALGPEPGTEKLVEYEARLNDWVADKPATLLCQYDRTRFDPSVIRDILRTHPIAIVGDHVCPNPFYEPAAAVLGEVPPAEEVEWQLARLLESRTREMEARSREEQLTERMKETECLYAVSSLLARTDAPPAAVMAQVPVLLPGGFRFPELARSRVRLNGEEWTADGFRETPWLLRAELPGDYVAGSVELAYLEKPPGSGPAFLPEEQTLLEGIAERISENARRRKAEEEARRSEARFRTLIEEGSDVIAILDETGTVRYAGPSFTTILGYPTNEILGTDGLDVQRFHPDDIDTVREEFRRLGDEPGRSGRIRYRYRHADGSWRVLESVSRNLLHDPAVEGLVINTRDVTEQQRLEAELHQARKMEAIGRLAGGVAHDFNNLLTAIRGYAALIGEQLPEDDPVLGDVSEIEKAAGRAAGLTAQLLAFGRKQVLKPRTICCNDVVREMENLLRRVIGEDVVVETTLTDGAGLIRVDPLQFEQVLLNLAVNARDAMPDGGLLRIATGCTGGAGRSAESGREGEPTDYAYIRVTDTGVGIPEDVRDRIFEPFFTTKETGTGLGLATVYGIVKQSGGEVGFRSEVGEGTTFEILFPRVRGDERAEEAEARTEQNAEAGGAETVLLAEDENVVRALARRVLERWGYTVLEAASGTEALRLARGYAGPVDLILTDLVMPGMGGPELAAHLLELRPRTPVVFMSGYSSPGRIPAEMARASIFLQKPFTPQELVGTVRRALDAEPRPGQVA